jgi:hypothetical protein
MPPVPVKTPPAMAPKINKTQHLRSDLRSVDVKGPIGTWEDDVLAAVFTVVLSQVAANGKKVVTAIGRSGQTYTYDDKETTTWTVRATVVGDGDLAPGDATVAAFATYAKSDGGSEWYSWTLPTRLER